jgi:hypothetical protein
MADTPIDTSVIAHGTSTTYTGFSCDDDGEARVIRVNAVTQAAKFSWTGIHGGTPSGDFVTVPAGGERVFPIVDGLRWKRGARFAVAAVSGGTFEVVVERGWLVARTLSVSDYVATLLDDVDASAARSTLGAVAKAGDTMTGALNMGGASLTNLAAPSSGSDAATKTYVDAVAQGLDVKQSVRAATAAALATYTASGTPKALTASANGALTVDGISVALNESVLIKDETSGNAKYNGIYTLTQLGDGSHPWILTRRSDFDASADVTSGAFTFVAEGSFNVNKGFVLTTADPITLDTTSLAFTQFNAVNTVSSVKELTNGDGPTYNVLSTDEVLISTGSSAIAIVLPTVSTGRKIRIYQKGAGVVTISSSSNIAGMSSYAFPCQYTDVEVVGGSSEWAI